VRGSVSRVYHATNAEEKDMKREDVAAVLAKPISQELLGSSIPARLA